MRASSAVKINIPISSSFVEKHGLFGRNWLWWWWSLLRLGCHLKNKSLKAGQWAGFMGMGLWGSAAGSGGCRQAAGSGTTGARLLRWCSRKKIPDSYGAQSVWNQPFSRCWMSSLIISESSAYYGSCTEKEEEVLAFSSRSIRWIFLSLTTPHSKILWRSRKWRQIKRIVRKQNNLKQERLLAF